MMYITCYIKMDFFFMSLASPVFSSLSFVIKNFCEIQLELLFINLRCIQPDMLLLYCS